jgi:hypothetical protein
MKATITLKNDGPITYSGNGLNVRRGQIIHVTDPSLIKWAQGSDMFDVIVWAPSGSVPERVHEEQPQGQQDAAPEVLVSEVQGEIPEAQDASVLVSSEPEARRPGKPKPPIKKKASLK